MSNQKEKDPGTSLPSVAVAQAEAAAQVAEEPNQHSHRPFTQYEQGSSAQQQPSEKSGINAFAQDPPIEHVPPPPYSETYGEVDFNQDGFDTRAKVADDGRVNIRIRQSSRRLSDLLVPALRGQLNLQKGDDHPQPEPSIPAGLGSDPGQAPPPPLNVVIHVVGSRGDVQPFVALGQVLKERYGHRVRLATHPTFKGFVEENGLEFFSIGGDPAELMAFMVKNPGLMPGMDTLRSGDVGKRRKGIYEIVQGCWKSCIEMGDGMDSRSSDDFGSRTSSDSHQTLDGGISTRPFIADAIIANPPSFAHIHIAEKLGIPLHLMFTMPWSPTQAFPHPLANVQSSNADQSVTNFVSYALVEMMTWQGLGDMINRFREKTLDLEPVSLMWAPGMASRLRIPYTYCWSPALIPKPKDWGSHISISGFYFLSLASSFTPEPNLAAFLEAGPPPVYIGFGSIVVDDPNAMTKLIFDAVRQTGQRALVSKGWGGFGADQLGIPDGVFMLGNVPHDWLFKKVSCVVHHGGAGTTAAGITLGKPTVIVPFFGDQPFWGAMVAKAGAGPTPIPYKHLTSTSLATAIQEALKPSTLVMAQELGARIASEKGTQSGAKSFQDQLGIDNLRCAVDPSRAAVWRVKRTRIRLSAFAATALGNEGLLNFSDLKLYRPKEYDSEDGPWDPITGVTSALLGTMGSFMMGIADMPIEVLHLLKIKPTTQSANDQKSGNSPGSSTPHDDADSTRSKSDVSLVGEGKVTSPESSSMSLATQNTRTTEADGIPEPRSPSKEQTGPLTPTSTSDHRRFLGKSLGRSSSRSRSSKRRSSSNTPGSLSERSNSASEATHMSLDAAVGAGRGVGRMVGVGLKSPMDFTLSLARGFHNAPKLYGDESVRQADKVTDFQSGLKVAGKEFGYGMYDGISGLVTQPLEGAKKEGIVGLIKGFGKGIGGVVLKPNAAFLSLPAYTFKGIYKEIQKHHGSSVQNYIIAARTAQGFDEWNKSGQAERINAVRQWQAIQLELSKEKHQVKHGNVTIPCRFMKTRHMSFDEKKKLAEERKKPKKDGMVKGAKNTESDAAASDAPLRHAHTYPQPASESSGVPGFEEAIQHSVALTSKGNPDEDAAIERAIRASLLELQKSKDGNEDEALRRAVTASVAEARRGRTHQNGSGHSEQLEAALHQSIQQRPSFQRRPTHIADLDFDDSGVDTDEDDNIKVAIESSKKLPSSEHKDEELERALAESKKLHEDQSDTLSKAKTEEEIVIEYVKRQSLAEAAYKDGTGR